MSERFLKRCVKKYFQDQGFTVSMKAVKLGNTAIDGEATGPKGEKVAIEIKTPGDDICRGIGQLAESMTYGYTPTLVTTLRNAKKIDIVVFHFFGWSLLGVNSKGEVHKIC